MTAILAQLKTQRHLPCNVLTVDEWATLTNLLLPPAMPVSRPPPGVRGASLEAGQHPTQGSSPHPNNGDGDGLRGELIEMLGQLFGSMTAQWMSQSLFPFGAYTRFDSAERWQRRWYAAGFTADDLTALRRRTAYAVAALWLETVETADAAASTPPPPPPVVMTTDSTTGAASVSLPVPLSHPRPSAAVATGGASSSLLPPVLSSVIVVQADAAEDKHSSKANAFSIFRGILTKKRTVGGLTSSTVAAAPPVAVGGKGETDASASAQQLLRFPTEVSDGQAKATIHEAIVSIESRWRLALTCRTALLLLRMMGPPVARNDVEEATASSSSTLRSRSGVGTISESAGSGPYTIANDGRRVEAKRQTASQGNTRLLRATDGGGEDLGRRVPVDVADLPKRASAMQLGDVFTQLNAAPIAQPGNDESGTAPAVSSSQDHPPSRLPPPPRTIGQPRLRASPAEMKPLRSVQSLQQSNGLIANHDAFSGEPPTTLPPSNAVASGHGLGTSGVCIARLPGGHGARHRRAAAVPGRTARDDGECEQLRPSGTRRPHARLTMGLLMSWLDAIAMGEAGAVGGHLLASGLSDASWQIHHGKHPTSSSSSLLSAGSSNSTDAVAGGATLLGVACGAALNVNRESAVHYYIRAMETKKQSEGGPQRAGAAVGGGAAAHPTRLDVEFLPVQGASASLLLSSAGSAGGALHHREPVTRMLVHPVSRTVFTAGFDGVVKEWHHQSEGAGAVVVRTLLPGGGGLTIAADASDVASGEPTSGGKSLTPPPIVDIALSMSGMSVDPVTQARRLKRLALQERQKSPRRSESRGGGGGGDGAASASRSDRSAAAAMTTAMSGRCFIATASKVLRCLSLQDGALERVYIAGGSSAAAANAQRAAADAAARGHRHPTGAGSGTDVFYFTQLDEAISAVAASDLQPHGTGAAGGVVVPSSSGSAVDAKATTTATTSSGSMLVLGLANGDLAAYPLGSLGGGVHAQLQPCWKAANGGAATRKRGVSRAATSSLWKDDDDDDDDDDMASTSGRGGGGGVKKYHSAFVSRVIVAAASNVVYSCAWDATVLATNLTTGVPQLRYQMAKDHQSPYQGGPSPLATVSRSVETPITAAGRASCEIAFSPELGMLAGAISGRDIYLWNVTFPGVAATLSHASSGFPVSLAFNSQDRHLIALGGDGVVCVWDLRHTAYGPLQILHDAMDQRPAALCFDPFHGRAMVAARSVTSWTMRRNLVGFGANHVGHVMECHTVTRHLDEYVVTVDSHVAMTWSIATGALLCKWSVVEEGSGGDALAVASCPDASCRPTVQLVLSASGHVAWYHCFSGERIRESVVALSRGDRDTTVPSSSRAARTGATAPLAFFVVEDVASGDGAQSDSVSTVAGGGSDANEEEEENDHERPPVLLSYRDAADPTERAARERSPPPVLPVREQMGGSCARRTYLVVAFPRRIAVAVLPTSSGAGRGETAPAASKGGVAISVLDTVGITPRSGQFSSVIAASPRVQSQDLFGTTLGVPLSHILAAMEDAQVREIGAARTRRPDAAIPHPHGRRVDDQQDSSSLSIDVAPCVEGAAGGAAASVGSAMKRGRRESMGGPSLTEAERKYQYFRRMACRGGGGGGRGNPIDGAAASLDPRVALPWLVAGHNDGTVTVFHVGTGCVLCAFSPSQLLTHALSHHRGGDSTVGLRRAPPSTSSFLSPTTAAGHLPLSPHGTVAAAPPSSPSARRFTPSSVLAMSPMTLTCSDGGKKDDLGRGGANTAETASASSSALRCPTVSEHFIVYVDGNSWVNLLRCGPPGPGPYVQPGSHRQSSGVHPQRQARGEQCGQGTDLYENRSDTSQRNPSSSSATDATGSGSSKLLVLEHLSALSTPNLIMVPVPDGDDAARLILASPPPALAHGSVANVSMSSSSSPPPVAGSLMIAGGLAGGARREHGSDVTVSRYMAPFRMSMEPPDGTRPEGEEDHQHAFQLICVSNGHLRMPALSLPQEVVTVADDSTRRPATHRKYNRRNTTSFSWFGAPGCPSALIAAADDEGYIAVFEAALLPPPRVMMPRHEVHDEEEEVVVEEEAGSSMMIHGDGAANTMTPTPCRRHRSTARDNNSRRLAWRLLHGHKAHTGGVVQMALERSGRFLVSCSTSMVIQVNCVWTGALVGYLGNRTSLWSLSDPDTWKGGPLGGPSAVASIPIGLMSAAVAEGRRKAPSSPSSPLPLLGGESYWPSRQLLVSAATAASPAVSRLGTVGTAFATSLTIKDDGVAMLPGTVTFTSGIPDVTARKASIAATNSDDARRRRGSDGTDEVFDSRQRTGSELRSPKRSDRRGPSPGGRMRSRERGSVTPRTPSSRSGSRGSPTPGTVVTDSSGNPTCLGDARRCWILPAVSRREEEIANEEREKRRKIYGSGRPGELPDLAAALLFDAPEASRLATALEATRGLARRLLEVATTAPPGSGTRDGADANRPPPISPSTSSAPLLRPVAGPVACDATNAVDVLSCPSSSKTQSSLSMSSLAGPINAARPVVATGERSVPTSSHGRGDDRSSAPTAPVASSPALLLRAKPTSVLAARPSLMVDPHTGGLSPHPIIAAGDDASRLAKRRLMAIPVSRFAVPVARTMRTAGTVVVGVRELGVAAPVVEIRSDVVAASAHDAASPVISSSVIETPSKAAGIANRLPLPSSPPAMPGRGDIIMSATSPFRPDLRQCDDPQAFLQILLRRSAGVPPTSAEGGGSSANFRAFGSRPPLDEGGAGRAHHIATGGESDHFAAASRWSQQTAPLDLSELTPSVRLSTHQSRLAASSWP